MCLKHCTESKNKTQGPLRTAQTAFFFAPLFWWMLRFFSFLLVSKFSSVRALSTFCNQGKVIPKNNTDKRLYKLKMDLLTSSQKREEKPEH